MHELSDVHKTMRDNIKKKRKLDTNESARTNGKQNGMKSEQEQNGRECRPLCICTFGIISCKKLNLKTCQLQLQKYAYNFTAHFPPSPEPSLLLLLCFPFAPSSFFRLSHFSFAVFIMFHGAMFSFCLHRAQKFNC